MRLITDLMEAAASTIPAQRHHELLSRRHSHHEDSPNLISQGVLNHGHSRINNGSSAPFNVIPDIRGWPQADQDEVVDNGSIGRDLSTVLADVLKNPQNYVIKSIGPYNNYIRVPETQTNTPLNGIAVGFKPMMATRGLDDEDLYDYAAFVKQGSRHQRLATSFKGKVTRAKNKANEETKKQAAAAAVAKQQANPMAFKPTTPPPSVVDISPRNRGIANPYFKGANQWRGDPAQTPWVKNGNKKCYDTIRLALHELGYDLVDMQHSDMTQWKDDYYYSTTADGKTVRIYCDPTMASGFLISFGAFKAYRVKRIYNASDYNATKASLKVYIDDAKANGRIV